MVSKIITKTYDNYYSGKKEAIDITYTLVEGFKSIKDAKEVVSKNGYDPEKFYYIKVDTEIYAVSMELIGDELIVTNSICYYRHFSRANNENSMPPEGYCDVSELSKVETQINNPRISGVWVDEIENDINELFEVSVVKGDNINKSKLPVHKCIILLGRVLFDTMIPVFELNVMDLYMRDSPSRWQLWKKGVEAYNPYQEKIEMGDVNHLWQMRKQYDKIKGGEQ